jgi:hypothetical protein
VKFAAILRSRFRQFLAQAEHGGGVQVDPTSGDMTFLTDRDVCASPRFSKMALIQ